MHDKMPKVFDNMQSTKTDAAGAELRVARRDLGERGAHRLPPLAAQQVQHRGGRSSPEPTRSSSPASAKERTSARRRRRRRRRRPGGGGGGGGACGREAALRRRRLPAAVDAGATAEQAGSRRRCTGCAPRLRRPSPRSSGVAEADAAPVAAAEAATLAESDRSKAKRSEAAAAQRPGEQGARGGVLGARRRRARRPRGDVCKTDVLGPVPLKPTPVERARKLWALRAQVGVVVVAVCSAAAACRPPPFVQSRDAVRHRRVGGLSVKPSCRESFTAPASTWPKPCPAAATAAASRPTPWCCVVQVVHERSVRAAVARLPLALEAREDARTALDHPRGRRCPTTEPGGGCHGRRSALCSRSSSKIVQLAQFCAASRW